MNKRILLGITGGIAAYKALDLASALVKDNIDVQGILTNSAAEFITPLALKTITRNEIYSDQFNYDLTEPLHIKLVEDIDAIVIAPATANILAKMAHGICDDLLSTTTLAYNGKFIIAPAMNTAMWENPITQHNVKIIKENYDVEFIDPVEGELACQTHGIGKLAEVETIHAQINEILDQIKPLSQQDLKGRRVLITAGGTREPLDPVRFIGNRSSGKMGIAMADEASKRGADVVLVSTNPIERNYQVIQVETAQQMQRAVEKHFDKSEFLVMAAAVSDYTPIEFSESKIKKSDKSDITITLTENPDILGTLGRTKKPEQILIGFAAESDNVIDNAKLKLVNKKADLIIANHITGEGIGFSSDYNEVTLISNNDMLTIPKAQKTSIARKVWDYLMETHGE